MQNHYNGHGKKYKYKQFLSASETLNRGVSEGADDHWIFALTLFDKEIFWD